ncbi:class I SAM-dependent methyltransferase [Elstera sp.]|jgi:hypothetical protein|uniref:class I SAM-dependent methyltransferase n=1 Tax=Elstera sp. TaxID=1916664 RepID=UPI0037BF9979
MSRLDSFINRMVAQRACLNFIAPHLGGPGLTEPVLELGLGNGRTYDHLRELFPSAPIFVFDRAMRANPKSAPPEAMMILGDVRETLPAIRPRLGAGARLIHSDIGDGSRDTTEPLVRALEQALPPLLADGAYIIADQKMSVPTWHPLPLPDGVAEGRYYIWQYRA